MLLRHYLSMEITTPNKKVTRITNNRSEGAKKQRNDSQSSTVVAGRSRPKSTRPAAGDNAFMVDLSRAAKESDRSIEGTLEARGKYDRGLRAFSGDSSVDIDGGSNVSIGASDSARDVTINGVEVHLKPGESLTYSNGELTINSASESQGENAPVTTDSQQAEENAEVASTNGTAQEVATEVAPDPVPLQPVFDQSTSDGFVESLYDGLLGRDADPDGAQAWKTNLENGEMSSADVVKNILKSEEFKNHQLDDQETVELLYETVLGREADAEGLAFHTQSAQDRGIEAVVADFFASDEFKSREAAGQARGRFAPEPAPAPTPNAAPVTPGSSTSSGSSASSTEAPSVSAGESQIETSAGGQIYVNQNGTFFPISEDAVELYSQDPNNEIIYFDEDNSHDRSTDPTPPPIAETTIQVGSEAPDFGISGEGSLQEEGWEPSIPIPGTGVSTDVGTITDTMGDLVGTIWDKSEDFSRGAGDEQLGRPIPDDASDSYRRGRIFGGNSNPDDWPEPWFDLNDHLPSIPVPDIPIPDIPIPNIPIPNIF